MIVQERFRMTANRNPGIVARSMLRRLNLADTHEVIQERDVYRIVATNRHSSVQSFWATLVHQESEGVRISVSFEVSNALSLAGNAWIIEGMSAIPVPFNEINDGDSWVLTSDYEDFCAGFPNTWKMAAWAEASGRV